MTGPDAPAPLQAVPVVDRLERDGRTLLLLEHQVAELSPLALAAYDAIVAGATAADLGRDLVARFGAPPGGSTEDAVAGVLEQLVALGLVVRP